MFKNPSYALLIKANLLLSIVLFLLFLIFNDSYENGVTLGLLLLGAISSATILVLLLYLLLFVFSFWHKKGLYVVAAVFVVTHLAVLADFFIYRIYHFHINAMVLNILTSPAATDSIQLGITPYIAVAAIVVFLIGYEWFVIKKVTSKPLDEMKLLNSKLNKITILPLFLIILTEKVSYGMAYLYVNSEVTSKFRVIPLYQPLTFTRLATKHFGFKIRKVTKTTVTTSKALKYPLEPISISAQANPVNIFIIASDAVRNSVISQEVTPNIIAFSKESWRYNNHYSGGNATRFGIFSMMYGLNATYWFSFLNSTRGSVFFEVLESLDYQISITSSTNTNWPEFRKTCYVDQQECIQDNFKGTPAQKDRQSTDALKKWLDKADASRPIFSFIFWDAPHQRSYPKEFSKFTPDNKGETNYLTVSASDRDVLFNQYKNSIAYNDNLFGEIIALLKEKGFYENSIIIFTSDHGQEFYEFGSFGHNSSFSRAQTQSPMIIKFPKQTPKKIDDLSSHVDLVPTLLSYVGVTNRPETYSNGFDMLKEDYKRNYIFTANWNNNAIITDKSTMVFSNLPNKIFNNEIRSTESYKKIPKSVSDIDDVTILDVLNQNRKFLK